MQLTSGQTILTTLDRILVLEAEDEILLTSVCHLNPFKTRLA